MKFEGWFTCPKCHKEMYHHGLQFEEDGLRMECWEEDGGCGNSFVLRPVIEKWITKDKFGYDTMFVQTGEKSK